jgi:hypothetical protein
MAISIKSAKKPTQFYPWKLDQAKSKWNLWEHGVTSSFLNCWVEDREHARKNYVEGYRGGTNLAFEYGTCNHWILEQTYADGIFWERMPVTVIEARRYMEMKVKEYQLLYDKTHPVQTAKDRDRQERVYGLAEAVMPWYLMRWDGDFTGNYAQGNNTVSPREWLTLEQVFRFDYIYPDGKRCPLRGRRDGTFLDSRNGTWVLDTKCRSVIKDEEALETLQFDIQQMLYLWITHLEMKQAKELSPWPKGTLMNIIRRPGLRQGVNETLGAFINRCKLDVAGETKGKDKATGEHVPRLDHYFVRNEMVVTPMELLEWKQTQLDPIMQGVRMWWEGTFPHFLSPGALTTKYGPSGMYRAIVKKDTSTYEKREHVFPELEI